MQEILNKHTGNKSSSKASGEKSSAETQPDGKANTDAESEALNVENRKTDSTSSGSQPPDRKSVV